MSLLLSHLLVDYRILCVLLSSYMYLLRLPTYNKNRIEKTKHTKPLTTRPPTQLPFPLHQPPQAQGTIKESFKLLSTSTAALPAPLPQWMQERVDREAADEQTRGGVDKWSGTMGS
jgi:hypothetical protein